MACYNCRCRRNRCFVVDPTPTPYEPTISPNVGAITIGTENSGGIDAGNYIPIETIFNLVGNNTFFIPGTVPLTLTSGTYIISFGANLIPQANGTAGIGLAINGTTFTPVTALQTATALDTYHIENSVIITVENGTTIALSNAGNVNTNYTNLILTANKIA